MVRSLVLWCFVSAATLMVPRCAQAQSGQEKVIQERLERTGSLAYEPAGKAFSADASFGGRRAAVRPFGFSGKTTAGKSGDGAFPARGFNDGRGSLRTDGYAVRQASAVDRQALPQADQSFGTRSVDVREDRAANRTLGGSRAYVNSEKSFLVQGKRQDSIDDLRKQKNLTIDQVREILNKNR